MFSTLVYSHFHIPSPGIFRTRGIFNTMWNFDQANSELCHSQNSLFRHYSAIFRTWYNPRICRNLAHSKSWNTQNHSINYILTHIHNHVIFTNISKLCVNLGNSEPWHIDNPGIFRNLIYLSPDTYSEPAKRLKMGCLAKIVKRYNYFSKFSILDLRKCSENAHLSISTH